MIIMILIQKYANRIIDLSNDDEILDYFSKIFKEYDIEYNPRFNTQYYRVRYLLD